MNFDYNKHLVYMALVGSRAYGTNHVKSDYDYRGIIIPPSEIQDGFLHEFEQKDVLEGGYTDNSGIFREFGKDSIAYDIRKFFKLAAKCNPNIIEMLFVPEDLVVVDSEYGKALREHKYDFLSMAAKHSFHGYAYSQLKRMKLHKKYWDDDKLGLKPPKPDREKMGLPYKPKLPRDKLNNLISVPDSFLKEDQVEYISAERKYAEAKGLYDKWRQWEENRNPERAKMEREFSYDGKFALHLVRLLKMCEEILETGDLTVRRPEASMLLDIRNGKWSYEELMEWVDEQEVKLNKLEKTSKLPSKPNYKKLENLCRELVCKARWENRAQ